MPENPLTKPVDKKPVDRQDVHPLLRHNPGRHNPGRHNPGTVTSFGSNVVLGDTGTLEFNFGIWIYSSDGTGALEIHSSECEKPKTNAPAAEIRGQK
jgi:hypothetical protein